MLNIDENMVLGVANLANLKLKKEEVGYFQHQLSRIIGYVGELADLPNLPECQDPSRLSGGVFPYQTDPQEREDILQPSLDPEQALVNAAISSGTNFQVPRIID